MPGGPAVIPVGVGPDDMLQWGGHLQAASSSYLLFGGGGRGRWEGGRGEGGREGGGR